jgi:siroheme synthase (precorrin-2 oxidase/ferrochelatase)
LGDFQVPAVGRAGRLKFVLSTGGSSPALAKALRRELERRLRASSVDWILGQLGRRRAWLKGNPRAKKKVVKALQEARFMRLLLDPSSAARRRALAQALSLTELAHA